MSLRLRLEISAIAALLVVAGLAGAAAQKGPEPAGRQGSMPSSHGIDPASSSPGSGTVPVFGIHIVNTYPHDPGAFTQGLVYDHGVLYESTGLNGRSTLRKVELETGKVLKSYPLPSTYFGEGLTLWHDRLIQLTWQSGVGFVYDKESFARQAEFRYSTQGWGIASDGESLIMSDGSSTLRYLDPRTFSEVKRIEVHEKGGRPVRLLNELEVVGDEIFANVWGQDSIARISPQTGEVLGWIDLSPLREELSAIQRVDVLNGIAYDAERHRLFVTGKWWPKLFEITVQ